jgi:SynChlorMet cassette protein ScmC
MYSLTLSNKACWWLMAGDENAVPIVDEVAAAMQLSEEQEPSAVASAHLIEIYTQAPTRQPAGAVCVLPQPRHLDEAPFVSYFHTALALAQGIQREGGLLLHAALAEYQAGDGHSRGVVFSAPGGTGKSTLSRRLTAPWRSWSDDASLVVPAGQGQYRAHPWPTWSRYLSDQKTGGRWPVRDSIPLSACIFLQQAPHDFVEPLGAGQAASLLVESARQINYWDRHIHPDQQRAFRVQRFEAVCELVKAVPAQLLHISLEGQFWQELEKILT